MAFGSGFGASGFGATSSGFGNPSQPLFGQPSNPFGQSTTSLGNFGQSAPSFGQSAPTFAQSAPQFGQSTPTPAFGQSAPAFGQSTSSFGNFGSSQPSLWGQSSAAFGASQTLGSSQPFGASQSTFGAAQPGFGAQSQALFGSSQPMFNQSQALATQSQFGSGWTNQNQQPPQPPSTRSVKYQISHLYDTNSTDTSKFMAISAMDQFQPFSIEELRVADYARGEKSVGPSTGMGSFGTGFDATGNAGFAAQSSGAFGSSVFGSQSQSGFGTQSQSLFGGQSQASLFGGSSGGAGAMGSSSGGLFGSTPNPAQGGMAGGGGGGVFGNTGFGGSGFGQPSTASSGFGTFGSAPQSQSLFAGGNQQNSGGLFGGNTQSTAGLFGSQPQSGGGLFGSQPQPGTGLFASQQSAGGLFGAQQSGGGLFGGQAQTSSTPFGASSSALGGTTAAGGLFGGLQGAQSAPSLFGASAGSALGSTGMGATGGLFGAQTGNAFLGNTGVSLFGTGASYGGFAPSGSGLFGAASGPSLFGSHPGGASSSSSLFGSGFTGGFGSGFGAHNSNSFQQQQQHQGPLEATLTKDPYGQSQLFSSVTSQPAIPNNALPNQPTTGFAAGNTSAGKGVRVIVESHAEPQRRMRGFETIARQEVLLRASGGDGRKTSPVRYWGPRRSLFDTKRPRGRIEPENGSHGNAVEWRDDEQKRKAASIRKLVIQPLDGDPILTAAAGQGFLRGKGPKRRPTSERQHFNQSLSVVTSAAVPESGLRKRPGRPVSFPLRTASREDEQTRPAEADETDADIETSIESDPAEKNGAETLGLPKDHGTEVLGKPATNHAATYTYPTSRERHPPNTEIEQFNSRYIPYKDYYKTQMRKTRQDADHHVDEPQHRQGIQSNSTSTLQTSPSIAALEKMSTSELSRVESFKAWKPTIGEIVWQEPVDLRGVNLDQMIRIEPKEVCVYPREEDLPATGEGLNKPAIVRLHGIWKKDKETGQPSTDASTVAGIVRKLKARCEEDRLEFLGYEVRTGTWTFRAHSF